jgi:hypothetical protein
MIGTSLSQDTAFIQDHTTVRHIIDLTQHHIDHITIIMVGICIDHLQDQITTMEVTYIDLIIHQEALLEEGISEVDAKS